jgi:predicted secreted protein
MTAMSLSMAIFTFINAWWIMLFMVLPFGVERPENRDKVEYAAAPKAVRWKKKFLVAAVLAAAVTALLAVIINSGLVRVDTLV